MSKKIKLIKEFLSYDDGLRMLKTLDRLNPPTLAASKVSTIKDVSTAMGLGLKETWEMVELGMKADLIISYGGILSKKRVDLSELGGEFSQCNTADDIKKVMDHVDD